MMQIPQSFTKPCMDCTTKSTYELWMMKFVPYNALVHGMSMHNQQYLKVQMCYHSHGYLSLSATLTDDCTSSRHAYVCTVIGKLKELTTLINTPQL